MERLPTNARKGMAEKKRKGIKAARRHRPCGQREHGWHRKKASWPGPRVKEEEKAQERGKGQTMFRALVSYLTAVRSSRRVFSFGFFF